MAGQVLQGAEGFLGHSDSVSGAGYLKKWKDDGEVDVVLHPQAPIVAAWFHQWHQIIEVTDKKTGAKKERIIPLRFNSMEAEKTLLKQYFREDDGSRSYPPQICPFSLVLEWVREAVEDRRISWVDPVFVFETKTEKLVIHAGGFTGLFQKNDLDDDLLEELKEAEIKRKEAYKENSVCSLKYVFGVIQYDAPEEGCVIAEEPKALGQKMKRAIRDEIDKWRKIDPVKGDPFKTPYVFRWKYDQEEPFDRAYSVVPQPHETMPITPEIQSALDDEPADLSAYTEPSNVALLKSSFMRHWVHEVVPPWDELFARALEKVKGSGKEELPEEFNYGANEKGSKAESKKREPKPEKKAESTPKPEKKEEKAPALPPESDEVFGCDRCQQPMKATEFTCKGCGAEYDPKTGLILPEKPKEEVKPRSRSQAKSESEAESPRRRGQG